MLKRGVGIGTAFSGCMAIMTVGLAFIIATARVRIDIVLSETQAFNPTSQLLISLLSSTHTYTDNNEHMVIKLSQLLSIAAATKNPEITLSLGNKEVRIHLDKIIEEKLKPLFKSTCSSNCHFILLKDDFIVLEYPKFNTVSYAEYLEMQGLTPSKIISSSVEIPLPDIEESATAIVQYAEVS